MAKEPPSIPAECWLSFSRLTCALSKSFSPFVSFGFARTNGNGTLPVSWFTNRSTLPLPRVRREIPSGMDSKRKPLESRSPTVMSGVTCTPGLAGSSIEGWLVRNPLLLAANAVAVPVAMMAVATAMQARIVRPLIRPSEVPGEKGVTDSPG